MNFEKNLALLLVHKTAHISSVHIENYEMMSHLGRSLIIGSKAELIQ